MPPITRVFYAAAWVCALTLMLTTASGARGAESWLGVSAGADFVNYSPMSAFSFEGGLWPEHKHFGYQAYVEYADASCDNPMWTIGAEPILRLHRVYGGVGLAYSNRKLCHGELDSYLNFSIGIGVRVSKRVDIQWRHRSHGADLGIEHDKSNDGVNLLEVRVRFYNR
jgi:hypothetical protein